ncbi:hypothetical protein N658DRAFT_501091 [Parathielavia hyrcaniae]|uniref:Extracellular serine-rich protein n=1 Tax=Parathielavia hyrcaniae TaxID=113614 RepID=A0AAN6PSB9_9PEZI|nr:hypothetical protein N658DRAFT_501091 [Parathielavia hyrcaniae]
MLSPITLILAASSLAKASSHFIPVSVGKTGLTFEPNEIHAEEGDVIEFRFWPRNHSVVAGDFHSACRPAEDNGFSSGFFPTQNGTVNAQVFRVTINHTSPMPIYCSQNTGQHCKNGMVAVINPSHRDDSLALDAYAALAHNAGNVTSPQGGAFGGVVAQNDAATTTATTTTSTASSTTTTTRETDTDTETASSTETLTQTETTESASTTATTTTTTGSATQSGGGGGTTTTAAAAGLSVPVAGLVAVAVGAFFV